MSKHNILIRIVASWIIILAIPLYLFSSATLKFEMRPEVVPLTLFYIIYLKLRKPLEEYIKNPPVAKYVLFAMFVLFPIIPLFIAFSVFPGCDVRWVICTPFVMAFIWVVLRDVIFIRSLKLTLSNKPLHPTDCTL